MIDYDYEQRLVDRIAVREAARALSPRQRQAFRACLQGETYREIGERHGLSTVRARQISLRALDIVRSHISRSLKAATVEPQRVERSSFDRAAFLRHMERLIARKRDAKRELFERELELMREMVAQETKPAPPPIPPTTLLGWPKPPPKLNHYVHNSPSYTPPPLPTEADLGEMAKRALDYLLLARPQNHPGVPWLGQWATRVEFTRDGGLLSEAVDNIVRALPGYAVLSAFPVPAASGVLSANFARPEASLRVTLTPDGLKLRFDVTWD